MEAVHVFAGTGLGLFLAGIVALWRATELLALSEHNLSVNTQQIKLLREARAMAEYGAHEEAQQLLGEAIKLGDDIR